MKKLFFLVVTLATSILLSSQTALAPSSSDIGEELPDTVTQSFDLVSNCFPDGILPGVFSVSADKQVQFSRGNLQYTQSTNTWSFAAQQYEFIGTDNVTGGSVSHDASGDSKSGTALADKIDLFGWSGSTATAKWGISISEKEADYSGIFVDWGSNIGDGKTWYTMTYDQWKYLINGRKNADNLKGIARINLNADGNRFANGLILLPDNWQQPTGVTFQSGIADEHNSGQAYANHQTFTLSEWQTMEVAGAVFLPASGTRFGTNIAWVETVGLYWSATRSNENHAYYFFFSSDDVSMSVYYFRRLYRGHAVRLIRNAK